jgi:hypothetical protein
MKITFASLLSPITLSEAAHGIRSTLPLALTDQENSIMSSDSPNVTAAAAVSDNIDVERMKTRLEGLSSYGVVSALLMSATLSLIESTNVDLSDETNQRVYNVFKIVFTASAILSVVAGVYTTVVFSLLELYAKTALGMGQDEPLIEFFVDTTAYRKTAFFAFLLSLISFETCFVSWLFLKYTGILQWLAVYLAVMGVAISFWHWSIIIDIAGKLLFKKSGSSDTKIVPLAGQASPEGDRNGVKID